MRKRLQSKGVKFRESIVPRTGEVLLTGGDRTINGARNHSSADVNFFDYLTNSMRKSAQPMAHPRWYPTVTTLSDGGTVTTILST